MIWFPVIHITTLRPVSTQTRVKSANNTGHTGVYARKNGKYSAVIVADYKTIRLGTFETFEEACKAYDIGKEKYHVIER